MHDSKEKVIEEATIREDGEIEWKKQKRLTF